MERSQERSDVTPHFHLPEFMGQVSLARVLANYARSTAVEFEGSVTIANDDQRGCSLGKRWGKEHGDRYAKNLGKSAVSNQ